MLLHASAGEGRLLRGNRHLQNKDAGDEGLPAVPQLRQQGWVVSGLARAAFFGKGVHGKEVNEPSEIWDDFAWRHLCASAPCHPAMMDGAQRPRA